MKIPSLNIILARRREEDRPPSGAVMLSILLHLVFILILIGGWHAFNNEADFSPFISASLLPAKGLPDFRPGPARESQKKEAELPAKKESSEDAVKLPELERKNDEKKDDTDKKKPDKKQEKVTEPGDSRIPTGSSGSEKEGRLGIPNGDSRGVGTQSGSGSISSLDIDDFEYTWYSANVASVLSSNWVKSIASPESRGTRVIVRFRISRDGSISDIYLIKPSNIFALDQEVIRAVQKSSPLPPLPSGFTERSLVAQYEFIY